MIRPSGIIAAMSTPFFEDETLNEEELRHQVDRLIGAGVHGIFALIKPSTAFPFTSEPAA